MTKKHFVMLAKAIKEHNFNVLNNRPVKSTYSPYGNQFDANQLETLADFCQSQNAQFDRALFLQACGVTTAPSTEVKCRKCGSPLTQQRYCWNEECEYYHKPQKVARTA